jgi:GT2 family glycosyltransferase
VALQIDYSRPRAARYDSGPVFGVNAAAALLSRRFLEAQPFADYFDEDLFMYLEDLDLGARAAVMGWKCYFVADAIAYHMGSASKRRHAATRLLHRNSGLVLLKNFPWPVLARMLGRAVANETRTLARYLVRDGPVPVAAALVGRLESLRYIARFLGKRRRLRKHWAVSPDDLWAVILRAQGTARPAPAVTPPTAV